MKKLLTLIYLIVFSITAFGQASDTPVEMADALHANGKIFIVVGVLLIIFTGIIIFLIRMDRKVTKLEKQIKEKKFLNMT